MHQQHDTIYFRLRRPDSPEALYPDHLPEGWKLEKTASREERHTFYDTFENQAFHKGLLIVRRKGRLDVTSLETGKVIADNPFPKTLQGFFPSSLENERVRELLLDCSELRAFSITCSIRVAVTSWKVLDDNQKSVAVMNSEQLWLAESDAGEPFMRLFSLTPLKGYHKELARILRALPEPLDQYRITGYRERFVQIIEASGRPLGGHSSKLRLQLDPEATIHESVRRLLQFTTSVMTENETGIRKDIDTEFLHDYRVASRRARSVLRQLKGVFEPHRTAWALKGLRELGKRSNHLRDSDVCLLRQAEYLSLLPPSLRPDLERFFATISEERAKSYRRFCSFLNSREHRNFIIEWQEFIADETLPDPEQAPDSALSTRAVAEKAIRKAWKKLIVHGRSVSTEHSDKELHELRIYGKRLRYLLEFFSSLFPPKQVAHLLSHLKELQEHLGDFVDVSVQLEFMLERIDALAMRKANGESRQAAAVGGLAVLLYQRREKSRKQFMETFADFDDERTRAWLDEILDGLE